MCGTGRANGLKSVANPASNDRGRIL